MKKKVVAATQSPMNAKRWFVTLACDHETWVTSTRRPAQADCMRVECNAIDRQPR
jgi:hypothetical protein